MPLQDSYARYATAGMSGPAEHAAPVIPDDAADLNWMTRAIMVTQAGSVTVTMKGGETATLPGLQPGALYPVRVARIHATGTDATGIVALW
jgi:hypothetical protein